MKNIKSIILFLPALLLTSCGARQIITPDAKKIMQDINANRQGAYDRSFDYSFDYHQEENNGGVSDAVYKYKMNYENNDTYYYQKGEMSTSKNSDDYYELYKVKNDKYEEVIYLNYQIEGTKDTVAFTKKDHGDDYYEIPAQFQLAMFVGVAFYQEILTQFTNPENVISGYESIVKYYSENSKHLKCVVDYDEKDEDTGGRNKAHIVVEYKDYLLSSYENKISTPSGNGFAKVKMAYDNVNIKLPNNWENYIKA